MGEHGKSGVRIAKRDFVVKRGLKAEIIHKSRGGVLSFNDLNGGLPRGEYILRVDKSQPCA